MAIRSVLGVQEKLAELLARQSSRGGHGKLGTKLADWLKDVDIAPAARKDKVVAEKRAESLMRTAMKDHFFFFLLSISGFLNDSFFHEALK